MGNSRGWLLGMLPCERAVDVVLMPRSFTKMADTALPLPPGNLFLNKAKTREKCTKMQFITVPRASLGSSESIALREEGRESSVSYVSKIRHL